VFGLLAVALALNGCGGSNSHVNAGRVGGTPMSEFEAILPDGSPMEIEILANDGERWSGEFAVAAETGPYAFQVGSFVGTVSGNRLNAVCEAVDGTEFTIDGTGNGDKGFKLTRSDIPGTVLNFQPVTPMATTPSRGETSFYLNTGGTNGRVILNSSPYAVHGTIAEYRGSWNNLPTTFWAYESGTGSLVIYIDPLCVATSVFSNYRLADFPTKTVSSSTGQMTMYSTAIRAQVKFKTAVTASP
jgi:hypothetical protein